MGTRARIGSEAATITTIGALAVSTGAGVFAIALADTAARFGSPMGEPLFWLGLGTLFVPLAFRLVVSPVPRAERLGATLLLTGGMYLVKVVHGPIRFVFFDEFSHLRTASDILASGRLFEPNPLLTVSPFYPGLEVATNAIANLAGVSVGDAGFVVIGAARIALALGLFLLLEHVSGSDRVAALGSLVYAGNPNFAFWSSQYAYESLALPLAIGVLYLAARAASSPREQGRLEWLIALVGIAIVMTHHVTTYFLVGTLLTWAVVAAIVPRFAASAAGPPIRATAAIAVAALAWLVLVAPATFGYLAPLAGNAVQQGLAFLSGVGTLKTFFRGDPSLVAPAWERIVAFGAVITVVVLLAAGLIRFGAVLRASRGAAGGGLGTVLGLGGLAYFPALAVRALPAGSEISNRAGEFLFVAVAFLVAPVLMALEARPRAREVRLALLITITTVVFAGGVIIGMPRWARLPGSFLLSGDTRAIQPESLDASAWLTATFGRRNGVIADQTNALVMGAFGDQDIRHGLGYVYFLPEIAAPDLRALREADVRFVVVDQRITTMLPLIGFYFESGEPGAGKHTTPLRPEDLAILEEAAGLRRVFDSGNVIVYELEPAGSGA
jgi:hypothetical protein